MCEREKEIKLKIYIYTEKEREREISWNVLRDTHKERKRAGVKEKRKRLTK